MADMTTTIITEENVGDVAKTIRAAIAQRGSASKLTNKRYLWGKPFDGSQDVYGDMSNVGRVTANGDITTTMGVSAKGISDFQIQEVDKTATITSLLPNGMIPDSTGIRLLKQGGRVTIQGQFTYTYGTSTSSVRMFTIPDEFMPNTNVNASWQVASGNIMWRCGINKSTKALYLLGIINPLTGVTTDTTSRTYSINFTYII